MNRTPVASSQIASVGYDPKTETLEIEFPNGAVYSYSDCVPSVHERLMEAESIGKFFGQYIKISLEYKKIKDARPKKRP